MFVQQQERSSGSRKLKLLGFFAAFWPGAAPSSPKCLVLVSVAECQCCVHCQEALKPRKEVPQVTPSVESVPSSRAPGSAMGSAKDSTDFK